MCSSPRHCFKLNLIKISPDIIAEIPHSIGWKPVWNKERFLQSVDDEVKAVVDLGKAKSSLVDSLLTAAMG
jgi:hypothetical protein